MAMRAVARVRSINNFIAVFGKVIYCLAGALPQGLGALAQFNGGTVTQIAGV